MIIPLAPARSASPLVILEIALSSTSNLDRGRGVDEAEQGNGLQDLRGFQRRHILQGRSRVAAFRILIGMQSTSSSLSVNARSSLWDGVFSQSDDSAATCRNPGSFRCAHGPRPVARRGVCCKSRDSDPQRFPGCGCTEFTPARFRRSGLFRRQETDGGIQRDIDLRVDFFPGIRSVIQNSSGLNAPPLVTVQKREAPDSRAAGTPHRVSGPSISRDTFRHWYYNVLIARRRNSLLRTGRSAH